jgi:hypothetical protein
MLNATSNNISVVKLVMEEPVVRAQNHRHAAKLNPIILTTYM